MYFLLVTKHVENSERQETTSINMYVKRWRQAIDTLIPYVSHPNTNPLTPLMDRPTIGSTCQAKEYLLPLMPLFQPPVPWQGFFTASEWGWHNQKLIKYEFFCHVIFNHWIVKCYGNCSRSWSWLVLVLMLTLMVVMALVRCRFRQNIKRRAWKFWSARTGQERSLPCKQQ